MKKPLRLGIKDKNEHFHIYVQSLSKAIPRVELPGIAPGWAPYKRKASPPWIADWEDEGEAGSSPVAQLTQSFSLPQYFYDFGEKNRRLLFP